MMSMAQTGIKAEGETQNSFFKIKSYSVNEILTAQCLNFNEFDYFDFQHPQITIT